MEEIIIEKRSKLNTIRGPKLDNAQENLSPQKNFLSGKNLAGLEEFHNEFQVNAEIKSQTNNLIYLSNENSLGIDLSKEAGASELDKIESSPLSERIIPKSKNVDLKVREKKQGGLYLINVFKRAKNFVGKIKKNLFYKQYNNMTTSQSKIINDLSHFPKENQNSFLFKVTTNNFSI